MVLEVVTSIEEATRRSIESHKYMSPKAKPHFTAYPCDVKYCKAKPGELCKTRRGARYPQGVHANRVWKGVEDGWTEGGWSLELAKKLNLDLARAIQ